MHNWYKYVLCLTVSYAHTYVCTYICTYECMYAHVYIGTYLYTAHIRTYVCTYIQKYVLCVQVCKYVRMYVHTYIYLLNVAGDWSHTLPLSLCLAVAEQHDPGFCCSQALVVSLPPCHPVLPPGLCAGDGVQVCGTQGEGRGEPAAGSRGESP